MLRRKKICWTRVWTVAEMRSRISIHLLTAFAVRCWISSPISPPLLNPLSNHLQDRNSEQCPRLIPWSWMRGLSLRQLETHSLCLIFSSDFHSSDSAKHNGNRNLSLLGRKTHRNSTYLLNILQLFFEPIFGQCSSISVSRKVSLALLEFSTFSFYHEITKGIRNNVLTKASCTSERPVIPDTYQTSISSSLRVATRSKLAYSVL